MGKPLALQEEMPLSSADSIAYMNPGTRYKLACVVNEIQWHETMHPLRDAIQWANACESYGFNDCYVSGNSFSNRRKSTQVRELVRFAVDLDYYNTEHKDLHPFELWEIISNQLPWLPSPSIIVDSGRGCYLVWKFKRPLPVNQRTQKYNFPTQWQTFQDFLIKQLTPFGADPRASDLTRVLRLPGTINSKNYATAKAWTCGPVYEFAELKAVFNEVYLAQQPPKQKNRQISSDKAGQKRNNIESLMTWRSLAWNRLRDLERLAGLRGGKFTNHRRMAIFYFAVEACHFCRSEEQLRAEIEAFVEQYIENPAKYNPFTGRFVNIKEVVKRFRLQEERGHFDWIDDRKSNRYRLKRQTIVNSLEITKTESRRLKALICDKHKYAKEMQRRRKSGVKPIKEHLKNRKETAASRAEEARKLYSLGMNQTQIAYKLEVSDRTVRNYLNRK